MNPYSCKEAVAVMNEIFKQETSIELPNSIEQQLNDQFLSLQPLINDELGEFIDMFDIGIQSLVEIHHAYSLLHESSKEHFAHIVLTAKVCTLLLAIRKLLKAGMVDACKALHRSLIETVDLLYVCIQNPDFASRYANTKEMYNNKDFYKRNIKDKRLQQDIRQLFNTLGVEPQEIRNFFKQRESSQEFLSNSLHGSFNAAFSNYMMFNLDFSDISRNLFGKVTTAYPAVLKQLLEEMLNLIHVFKNAIDKKMPTVPTYLSDSLKRFFHFSECYTLYYENNISQLASWINDINNVLTTNLEQEI